MKVIILTIFVLFAAISHAQDSLSYTTIGVQNKTSAKYTKYITLNPYNDKEVQHFTGKSLDYFPFHYLQLAQRYTLPKNDVQLLSVKITRLVFKSRLAIYAYLPPQEFQAAEKLLKKPYTSFSTYKSYKLYTKFRLKIYGEDTKTGMPSTELYTKIIEVEDKKNNRNITIDLKKYGIYIPDKHFFVAVEWLFEEGNFTLPSDYQPFIGINPKPSTTLNIYGLTSALKWEPFTWYTPDLTDLAMEVKVGLTD